MFNFTTARQGRLMHSPLHYSNHMYIFEPPHPIVMLVIYGILEETTHCHFPTTGSDRSTPQAVTETFQSSSCKVICESELAVND